MGADQNGVANYCRRPPQRPFLQKIQYAIWDPEERKFLGRTPKRWGVIGLIYLVMYICIVVFFSICMCGLLAAVDEHVPYFTLAESIIGNNPGMGHRPIVFEEGALIWYRVDNATTYKKYIDNIDEFLAPYKNKTRLANQGVNQVECGPARAPPGAVCSFDPRQLGPCHSDNSYGYADGQPCIIIKLNKIYDWSPELYEADLPPDAPPDILRYINTTKTPQERRKIWVSCQGERPADTEALGPLQYWPYPGLSDVYFPYNNTPGYLSPLVAVQLMNPARSVIINIRCRAWARNVVYSTSLKERLGSTHLELMID